MSKSLKLPLYAVLAGFSALIVAAVATRNPRLLMTVLIGLVAVAVVSALGGVVYGIRRWWAPRRSPGRLVAAPGGSSAAEDDPATPGGGAASRRGASRMSRFRRNAPMPKLVEPLPGAGTYPASASPFFPSIPPAFFPDQDR